ncbi:MAG: sigma-70 family RNA polymerase sigma factor [Kiritimatiellae bacterium]|nr:sigma-70 family RNA polymerase sigma factor [Kiritimatiellia bacterium]
MKKRRKQSKAEQLIAFNTIVARYEEQLLRYASRIVGGSNAAQDIVQNTFIKLFKKWTDELEPSPKLSSWLYRVAHNCAVDYIRKESRRHLLHLQHAEEIDNFIPPNRGDGFHIGEQAERAAASLRTLTSREQQLVVLKIYEEKSYKEIGEITGLTVTNIGYILHHAMKKMAAELAKVKTHE